MSDDDDQIDFDAAETFLMSARQAYDQGDQRGFEAARKLVSVALCMKENPPVRMRIEHLKSDKR